MTAAVRIMIVMAVITGVLSFGAIQAARPDGGGPPLRFELTDGSVITGRIDAKVIAIKMPGGSVMKIPPADMGELQVGLNDRPGLVKRAEALIEALDSSKTRQDAAAGLLALGPAVGGVVKRYTGGDVSARRGAVAQLLKAYENWYKDHPGVLRATARPLPTYSNISAGKSQFISDLLGVVYFTCFKHRW